MTNRGVRAVGWLLSAVVPLACAAPAAWAAELPSPKVEWSRVRTANFTIYTSAGLSKTKEIGLELETLRAVLASVKGSAKASYPIPTVVFVFRDDDSLIPYKPRWNGKPSNVAAFFQGSSDGNYIALAARSRDTDPQRIVYHEFLHYFMRSNFLPQPAWYEEGLAEFYSTFQLVGNEARVGQIVRQHIQTLRQGPLIPLEQLLGVDKDSPEYNEGDRAGMFYAESWALVHYLMRGQPGRTAQLGRFLVDLQNGRPRDEAFRERFQTNYAGLFGELRLYIDGGVFHYTGTQMADLQIPKEFSVEKVGYDEILARLGELLAHGRDESLAESEAYFREALARRPASAEALGGLGFLRLRQENYPDAAEYLRRAVASGSGDFRTYFHYGQLCLRELSERPIFVGRLDPEQRETLEEARSAFRKSLELNGNFAEARAELGRTYLAEDSSCASEGIADLEIAVRLLPSRDDLARDLAALRERATRSAQSNEVKSQLLERTESATRARQAAESSVADGIDRVNALLAARREDEALRLFEDIVAAQPEESRKRLADRLTALRKGVKGKRAIRRYNEGVSLANKRDFQGALLAFRSVAETAEDPELAKQARAQIKTMEAALPRKIAPSGKSDATKN